MNIRFIVDESSWMNVNTSSGSQLESALKLLIERIDVATRREEDRAKHESFYETGLGDSIRLYSLLFEKSCPIQVDRDTGERLRLALDKMYTVDDSELEDYDVCIAGSSRFSPGVAWAHAQGMQGRAVAALPLNLDDSLRGRIEVSVKEVEQSIHFVTTEHEHRTFFRDTIEVENKGAQEIAQIATSAFPDLEWIDSVWRELNAHERCFIGEHRKTLVSHLSVLDDKGASFFNSHPGGDGVEQEFGSHGVGASNESGETRRHNPSKTVRTRIYRGSPEVFWWHTKITWDEGRIHFLHVPFEAGSEKPPQGHIVIGIFTNHCTLPG